MIRVNMSGEMARKVRAMRARAGDFGPAMESYGAPKLKTLIDDGFRQKRDPRNLPWARLNDETIERKTRQRYTAGTLIRTGKLRNEVTVQNKGPKIIVAYSPATEYGQFHQWPDVNSEQRMPLRRFLPFVGPSTAPRVMHQGRMAGWFKALEGAVKTWIDRGKVR